MIEISPTRPNAFYVFMRITLFWFVKFDEKKDRRKNTLMCPLSKYVLIDRKGIVCPTISYGGAKE